jgi:hypothetical protein
MILAVVAFLSVCVIGCVMAHLLLKFLEGADE